MKPTVEQLKRFGETLKEICARRGLGVRTASKVLGVHESAVSILFKPRANPDGLSIERIKKIAERLNCTDEEFAELLAAIGHTPAPSSDESEAIAALLDKHLPRRKHKVRAALAELLKEYTVQPRPRMGA
jgi:transcriptional regulator with XRE-family HTH domain